MALWDPNPLKKGLQILADSKPSNQYGDFSL